MLVAHASRLKFKCQVSLFARMLFRMLCSVVTDVRLGKKTRRAGLCVFLAFSLSVNVALGEIEE